MPDQSGGGWDQLCPTPTYLVPVVDSVVVENDVYTRGLCEECSKCQFEGHHSHPKDKVACDSGPNGVKEGLIQPEKDD